MSDFVFLFTNKAKSDLKVINKNEILYERVKSIIESIAENPISGIGKPEKLKHRGNNAWSRRVSDKDRLEYIIRQNEIIIVSILGHYDDK